MDELQIINRRYRFTPDLRNKIATLGYESVQLETTLEEIKTLTISAESRKPNIAWQLEKAFIHAIAEYPNAIGKSISKEIINNIEKDVLKNKLPNAKDTEKIINSLAQEFEKQIRNLDKSLRIPSKLIIIAKKTTATADKATGKLNPAFEVIYFDEDPKSNEVDKYFEKNGLFLFDYQFLEFIKTFGKYSKEYTENLTPGLKESYNSYKKNGSDYFDFCFNMEATPDNPFFMSHALIILARVILHDIVLKNIPKAEIMSVPGHLSDMMLPQKKKRSIASQAKIVELGSWELANIGLTGLSLKQHKAFIAISTLLHKKSQHTDPKLDTYYAGNSKPRIVECGGVELVAPVISWADNEYHRVFTGNEMLGGTDIKTANEALIELINFRPSIYYQRKQVDEHGKVTYQVVEYQKPIIEKITVYNFLTLKEKASITNGDEKIKKKKGESFYILNPIFRDQITSKFTKLPEDIIKRIKQAANELKISENSSTYLLLSYLNRAHSAGDYHQELNEETLTKCLELINLRQDRRQDRINKDIKILKAIGLIRNYEKMKSKTSAVGQKHIFHLNQEWPTDLLKEEKSLKKLKISEKTL